MAKVSGSVKLITNSLNKKGVIKADNKKKTKRLKSMCPHHIVKRNGKIKPMVKNNNGECRCKLCGATFTTALYDKEKTKEIVSNVSELLAQARFINEAGGMGEESGKFLAETSVKVDEIPKVYGKMRKILEKSNKVKNKKKSKGGYGGSSLGGWEVK